MSLKIDQDNMLIAPGHRRIFQHKNGMPGLQATNTVEREIDEIYPVRYFTSDQGFNQPKAR